MRASRRARIARREVIYVEGWDPQGAEGYYRLFERSVKRFRGTWPLEVRLGELQFDSQAFAHWDIETSGPNWRGSAPPRFFPPGHPIPAPPPGAACGAVPRVAPSA